jgi:hypothetical protein
MDQGPKLAHLNRPKSVRIRFVRAFLIENFLFTENDYLGIANESHSNHESPLHAAGQVFGHFLQISVKTYKAGNALDFLVQFASWKAFDLLFLFWNNSV